MTLGDIEQRICDKVRSHIAKAGLWNSAYGLRSHLISPAPFDLSTDQVAQLEKLGEALFRFYHGANELYLRSNHEWVRNYLDIGKPDGLIRHARMHYHKHSIPRIIRPDILIRCDGFVITELDSVPGGFGHLDCLSAAYDDAGFDLIGSPRSVRDGFAQSLREAAGIDDPVCAIVVSEESVDYLPEMTYLAGELQKIELRAYTLRPSEIEFTEGGLFVEKDSEKLRIDLIYRFFELFDLLNIPKSELVSYAARKKTTIVTPPYKHFLEEKMLLAFLHSESLKDYWVKSLGDDNYKLLISTVSPTWIMDNRAVPPHAQISGFKWKGRPIRDWREIIEGTQKDRRLVLKPSGFSPLAWGSRGVKIGHDMPGNEWADTANTALSSFENSPYVIQPYHDSAIIGVKYCDENRTLEMQARVRLCPYYFVADDRANLGGVLATACPKDKKLIHGMVDAIMMPCQSKSSRL
ncbi:MAG: hypothetical protein ABFD83_13415 [Armatimonadota bacterium]